MPGFHTFPRGQFLAARKIFRAAIQDIRFEDAKRILSEGDTAAKDYFRQATATKLTAAFTPPVEAAMADTGVTRQFQQLTNTVNCLPVGRGFQLDITSYVVSKALDGIFLVLGQEEKKIRANPAARITPWLKEVFGARR